MSPPDAFKAGFFFACGDMGLTGPEVTALAEKAAALLDKRAFMSGLQDTALSAAVGLPVLTGAGVGYMAHKLRGGGQVDPEDVRTQELIDELKKFTARARESQRQRALRGTLGV